MKVYYTDYPIIALGDIPNKKAQIREIYIISYDGNKYCDILVGRVIDNIKAGYIYNEPGRCGEVSAITIKELESYKKKWQIRSQY